jgi:hypothetical protein
MKIVLRIDEVGWAAATRAPRPADLEAERLV